MEPDGGTTNIRNVKSKHWTRWLGAENRCVVPFNSFSEFNKAEGGDTWFARDESRPLACFAGIWTNWTSVRKVKEGETTNDIFAFLTTEPNAEVGAIHPKAMPVMLNDRIGISLCMNVFFGTWLDLMSGRVRARFPAGNFCRTAGAIDAAHRRAVSCGVTCDIEICRFARFQR